MGGPRAVGEETLAWLNPFWVCTKGLSFRGYIPKPPVFREQISTIERLNLLSIKTLCLKLKLDDLL